MKFIQSLWTHDADLLSDGFGWLSPQYHLMSWALSSLLLNKHYGNTCLYTDEQGYRVLIEELQLPYTKTEKAFNNLQGHNANLWAVPKLLAYSLQNKPFLHLDGDVYLWKKLPDDLLKENLIAQNIEISSNYYKSLIRQHQDQIKKAPHFLIKALLNESPPSYNAGIIGGKDVAFFRKYAQAALSIAKNNQHITHPGFNIIYEQILFAVMTEKNQHKVKTLLSEPIQDNGYSTQNICNFHEPASRHKYMHVIGKLKKHRGTCEAIARALLHRSPVHYQKIIRLFDKKNFFSKEAYGSFRSEFINSLAFLNNRLPGIPVDSTETLKQVIQDAQYPGLRIVYLFDTWLVRQKKTLWKNLPQNYFQIAIQRHRANIKDFNRPEKLKANYRFRVNPLLAVFDRTLRWDNETLGIVTGDTHTDDVTREVTLLSLPTFNQGGVRTILADQLTINLLVILQTGLDFEALMAEVEVFLPANNKKENHQTQKLILLRLQSLIFDQVVEVANLNQNNDQ